LIKAATCCEIACFRQGRLMSGRNKSLLFMGVEQDEIIPLELCEKNSRAYEGVGRGANYKMFPVETN